jgi:hypothetical protein
MPSWLIGLLLTAGGIALLVLGIGGLLLRTWVQRSRS